MLPRVKVPGQFRLVPSSMKLDAEPWGPCAAGATESLPWQSEHIIVWVPTFTFQGATSCAAVSALGASEPPYDASPVITGWPDRLLELNACARSVSTSPGGPLGGLAPKANEVWHLKQIWYSAVATAMKVKFDAPVVPQSAGKVVMSTPLTLRSGLAAPIWLRVEVAVAARLCEVGPASCTSWQSRQLTWRLAPESFPSL